MRNWRPSPGSDPGWTQTSQGAARDQKAKPGPVFAGSRSHEPGLTPAGGVLTFPAKFTAIPHDSKGYDMAVGKVSDADFETEVLKASGPVVVDFWAEWCGPCRMIAPALDEIQTALGEKVKIVKLNVDENPGVASKYGIMSIPTLMIFKNGELASRQVGAAPKAKLEQWINAAV
jgi:thioredoxin 1